MNVRFLPPSARKDALPAAGAVVRALPDPSGEVAAWIGARPYAGG
jgi:hypothetical protein